MQRWPFFLAMLLAVGSRQAEAAYPGNGFWGVQSARKSSDAEAQPKRPRRVSRPLDIYPAYDPHYDNSLYARGLTPGGGSAYMSHNYRGRAASVSYSYYDGGFNPNGSLYGLSNYPHYDRPGFSYWAGGQ
jgi:hypothetical protein